MLCSEQGPWQALHVEKSTFRAKFMQGVTLQGQGTGTGEQCDPAITLKKAKQAKAPFPPAHGENTSETLLVCSSTA